MPALPLRKIPPLLLGLLALVIFPSPGECSGLHELSLNFGKEIGAVWVLPFVCMLLSIAICPLAVPHFWEHNFGKVAVFWALAVLAPFALIFGPAFAFYEFLHSMLLEYIPFIILLFALFTVAGGIRLKGSMAGTPLVNTGLLLTGTVLASWMGTTGAAMLIIRPLLRANAHRRYKVHTVVFCIFLVANIGGCLTPLGDPPLFLGFLQGVDFFWTLLKLLPLLLFLSVALLALYFLLDSFLYAKEGKPANPASSGEKIGLEGMINFPLLACIVASVLLSGVWRPEVVFSLYGIEVELQNVVRDLLLLLIAAASFKLTSQETRQRNDFSWGPILEVGKLFFGIFISMIPALAILKAGSDGALSSIINMVSDNGQPNNAMFFWMAGALSSFLDNAPTYLVFFNTAGGIAGLEAEQIAGVLMTDMASTLVAISAGAVFMGANSYIGNAPNFMVRSIAEDMGVKMPSFFGYMGWSVAILIPLFILVTFLFI
ncbi:MAG: sodium:proton antiporter [Deltaproteobacteria bacterium]|jgi:Na+/H+ antiporter NhaD/arsenite permease-like protein|nr:sodium:proton antiporter [Deltaproteobacteria bacterium]